MNTILKALLVAAIALPSVGGAQTVFPVAVPAPVERAALDRTAASSSSADWSSSATARMFAGAGQSTITIQPPPVVNKPHDSKRPLSSVGVGVKAGVGGVGFDVATPLVPGWVNLRGGASFFTYNHATFTTNNIDIDGSVKLQNAAAVVDVFPFHGGFRLSGGMTTYNNTGLTAILSVPAGQGFKLGTNTFYSSATDPIHGTGSLSFGGKTAGRASIGTGNMLPRKGRFTFETEFGVQFFTPPTVVFNIKGSACTSATDPLTCGSVQQSDVTAEQNKLQDDLTSLKYYPILSFGFSYKIH